MPTIALLGTLDTKLHELLHLRSLLLSHPSTTVLLIDTGRSPTSHPSISIPQPDVLSHGPSPQITASTLQTLPRSQVLAHLTHCTTALLTSLHKAGEIHAAISAGGSGGSSLAAAAMRTALPLGVPKLLVSTIASGDVGPLVDGSDLVVMYSVVDVAGWNGVLERVFALAAGAVVGMARVYEGGFVEGGRGRVRVGMTMFGVTTPCVDFVRKRLEEREGYEVYVFHATGTGGKAMERMIEDGELDAVADVTTTEVADFIVGGNMSAGEKRLEAAARRGLPCVVSLGAVDMVNFGPKSTVPSQHSSRQLHEHNASVTLMRTTASENTQIGSVIASKLRDFSSAPGNVKVLLPLGSVSMLSAAGQAFEDKEADEACFVAVRQGLEGSGIEVVEDARGINEEGFAGLIADVLVDLVEGASKRGGKGEG